MEWKVPFIIYRVNPGAGLEEVFHCHDMKKAKYWLQYIAQEGDVLCRTPIHPKHTKSIKTAEYWSHKEGRSTVSKENVWKEFAAAKNCKVVFPEEQLSTTQP